MSGLNNPKNVIGMAELYADDDEDIDIDKIEKSITTGIVTKSRDVQPVDITKEYSKEIDDLGKRFNIGSARSRPSMLSSTDNEPEDNRSIDDLLNLSSYSKSSASPKSSVSMSNMSSRSRSIPTTPSSSSSYKAPYNLTEDEDEDDEDEDSEENTSEYYPSQTARPSWSASVPQDEQLSRMTDEERKQSHLSKVLGNIDSVRDDAVFLQQEDEEDEMAKILEQIDLLRTNLENEGISLDRIPNVGVDSTKKEATSVLKILRIKNDRLRYCDFFEEGILAVAYGLEGIFNGEREIFGSKIDLTGYSDTVKVKLRRMRYDTSNFVSSVMQGYNINSGWRIVLELIPSLFLYSRDRRLKANDNLMSDDAYKKAMQDLP